MEQSVQEVEEVLRRVRARPTATEAERIGHRVRATGRPRNAAPRLALTSAVVAGALLVGGGTTFAFTGLDKVGSAASFQYPHQVSPEIVGHRTQPVDQTVPVGTQGQVPAQAQVPAQTSLIASPSRTATGELPFTGLAAGAVILLGALMLVGGVVLRRRSAPGR